MGIGGDGMKLGILLLPRLLPIPLFPHNRFSKDKFSQKKILKSFGGILKK